MYCKKCGSYMPDEADYCPACGARAMRTADVTVAQSVPFKRSALIGIIAAVTVIVVVVIVCFTVLFASGKIGQQDTLDQEAAQQTDTSRVPAMDTTAQTDTDSDDADTADTESADTQTDDAETADTQSEAASATAAQSSEAQEEEDEPETVQSTTTVTNNYYYYGANAVRDNDYYTRTVQSQYLWPTDTQYISMSDLSGLSQDTVAAIRNEIYARHGYAFQTARWRNYFANKTWYYRDSTCTESTINARLSSVERANINTIVAYEESMGWR